MKKIISDIYHKYLKYNFDPIYEEIDFKYICETEKVISELYRYRLFHEVNFKNCKKVLDYGGGYGVNLKIIKDIHNDLELNYMDISRNKRSMFKIINENIYKMSPNILEINKLKNHEKNFDLVFTDAVLIYINKNNIKDLLRKLINSSKKNLLFHELTYKFSKDKIYHLNIHDYEKIIKEINPKLKIKIIKSEKKTHPWNSHGAKIIVNKYETN